MKKFCDAKSEDDESEAEKRNTYANERVAGKNDLVLFLTSIPSERT